jgi:hypothetical protein
MDIAVLSRKQTNRLLRKLEKARRKCKPGEPQVEFSVLVKEPPASKCVIRIISGTVPASFRWDTPASRKRCAG